MQEKVIPKDKRFVSIKQYCEISGLSYNTVDYLLKSGQLNYVHTESGQRKVDTKDFASESPIIIEKLEKTEKMLTALCKQFNVVV